MRRTIILDSNVLLHDPQSIYAFEGAHLVIPITVIAEIDKFKKGVGEVSRNAREASRIIDDLRVFGPLAKGVKLEGGGRLTVAGVGGKIEFPDGLSPDVPDDRILAVALAHPAARGYPKRVVTMDVNMRIKAAAYGLEATGYEDRRVSYDDLFQGYHVIDVDAPVIEEFYAQGHLLMDEENVDLQPNEGTVLRDTSNLDRTALGRYDEATRQLILIREVDMGLNVRPRNLGQRFALNFLLDKRISLVTLAGRAGTGKTLLALAAGLKQVLEDDPVYRRLVVSRPVFPMGKELGYLPGSLEEKLGPWMAPIHDNLDQILESNGRKEKGNRWNESRLKQAGLLEVEPLSYIRGRSMPRQFFIVDEAQNLTPHEVKTIVSRAGHNTKVVLTGDPDQIDNPYVDALSNGLAYVIDRFRGQRIAAHATLTKGERSRLAELAADLL